MSIKSLAKSDINLIVAFQALMDERNVTRAAAKMHISQPAMSNALSRLRVLFDDPLFTRAAHGIVPTPKAQELSKDVPEIMGRIDRLINPAVFQPESYSGEFVIGCGDRIGEPVARLFSHVHALAEHVKFDQVAIHDNYLDELRTGRLDFAIHYITKVPEDIVVENLFDVKVKVAMRKSHPLSGKKRLSLKDFLKYPHVRLKNPGGRRVIDLTLAAKDMERNVLLMTQFNHIARSMLLTTDYLQVTGEQLFSEPDDELHLADLPNELPASPVVFRLLQHQRTCHSNAHNWLKEQIVGIIRRDFLPQNPGYSN